jgi:hypothetical protein
MQMPEWIETAERWLGRIHLAAWIIGAVIGVAASIGTVIAGITQLLPPWWVIPAGLVTLSLPIFAADRIQVIRERQHPIEEDTKTPIAFPYRSTFITIFLSIIIGLPIVTYIVGYPERPTPTYNDARIAKIEETLTAVSRLSMLQAWVRRLDESVPSRIAWFEMVKKVENQYLHPEIYDLNSMAGRTDAPSTKLQTVIARVTEVSLACYPKKDTTEIWPTIPDERLDYPVPDEPGGSPDQLRRVRRLYHQSNDADRFIQNLRNSIIQEINDLSTKLAKP